MTEQSTMEATNETSTEDVSTVSESTESQDQGQAQEEPAQVEAKSDSDKWAELEAKWAKDPDAVEKATEDELELFNKWKEGKLTKEEKEQESQPEKKVEESWKTDLMKKVGAKSEAEIQAKVDGLIKAVQDRRENHAAERDQYKTQADNYGKALNTQHQIILDIAAGKPEAIARAKEIAKQAGLKIEDSPKPQGKINRDELVDPELYDELEMTKSELQAIKQNFQQIQDRQANELALASIEDEMVGVATEFQEYGLNGSEVRGLFKEWIKSKQIPEKLKPLQELMQIADEKRLPLKDAHKLIWWDKRGTVQAQTIAKQPISKAPNLSAVQKQAANPRRYSDSELDGMLSGNVDYPDSWKTGGAVDIKKAPGYAQDYWRRK